MKADSVFLLHITSIGRSMDFTNWYRYERQIAIQTPNLMMETEKISVTLVFISTLISLIAQDFVILLTEQVTSMWKKLLMLSHTI
jgi:hypothetical protein